MAGVRPAGTPSRGGGVVAELIHVTTLMAYAVAAMWTIRRIVKKQDRAAAVDELANVPYPSKI